MIALVLVVVALGGPALVWFWLSRPKPKPPLPSLPAAVRPVLRATPGQRALYRCLNERDAFRRWDADGRPEVGAPLLKRIARGSARSYIERPTQ